MMKSQERRAPREAGAGAAMPAAAPVAVTSDNMQGDDIVAGGKA